MFCNATARERGVRPGQSLKVAHTHDATLVSRLLRRERLVAAHRAVLRRLVELSPRVGESRLSVFWAEPFGDGWAHRVADAFAQPLRIGIGPDATTAYAAARYTKSILEVHPSEARSFLDRSPITVLELPARTRRALASLGIRRVGELRAFDPTSLAMRLGPEVAEAWHRADGNDPRGPRFARPREPEEAQLELDEAVDDLGALIRLLGPMASSLATGARERDRAIVELRLRLDAGAHSTHDRRQKDSHTRARNRHGSGTEIVFRTASPTTDSAVLVRGIASKLDALDRIGEVRQISLRSATVDQPRETESLLAPSPAGLRQAALARLKDRLGADALKRASALDTSDWSRRAQWVDLHVDPRPAPPWPFRRPRTPVRADDGAVQVAGRIRKVIRIGRRERISRPWWDGRAFPATEVCAWAEVEGPILVLLRESAGGWEVVGWLD